MIDKTWTLFLDRDGVINHRIPGSYVRYWEEFEYDEGSLEAIVDLTPLFNRIVVVTNQQGIGKGIMTEEMLAVVHNQLQKDVLERGGLIDKIYHCPKLAKMNPACRKPNPGMAHEAKKDFPEIDFSRSIMVGDSISDMEFGIQLDMKTIFITTKPEAQTASEKLPIDHRFSSLKKFAKHITSLTHL